MKNPKKAGTIFIAAFSVILVSVFCVTINYKGRQEKSYAPKYLNNKVPELRLIFSPEGQRTREELIDAFAGIGASPNEFECAYHALMSTCNYETDFREIALMAFISTLSKSEMQRYRNNASK